MDATLKSGSNGYESNQGLKDHFEKFKLHKVPSEMKSATVATQNCPQKLWAGCANPKIKNPQSHKLMFSRQAVNCS